MLSVVSVCENDERIVVWKVDGGEQFYLVLLQCIRKMFGALITDLVQLEVQ
jgi:hypothetical protein